MEQQSSVLGLWAELRGEGHIGVPQGSAVAAASPIPTHNCPSRASPFEGAPPGRWPTSLSRVLSGSHPPLAMLSRRGAWRPGGPDPGPHAMLVWPALWPQCPRGLCSQLAASEELALSSGKEERVRRALVLVRYV